MTSTEKNRCMSARVESSADRRDTRTSEDDGIGVSERPEHTQEPESSEDREAEEDARVRVEEDLEVVREHAQAVDDRQERGRMSPQHLPRVRVTDKSRDILQPGKNTSNPGISGRERRLKGGPSTDLPRA
jgi:hypothetical protein